MLASRTLRGPPGTAFWGDREHWDGVFDSLPGYRLSKFQPLMPPWVEREVIGSYLLDVIAAEKWLTEVGEHGLSRGRLAYPCSRCLLTSRAVFDRGPTLKATS